LARKKQSRGPGRPVDEVGEHETPRRESALGKGGKSQGEEKQWPEKKEAQGREASHVSLLETKRNGCHPKATALNCSEPKACLPNRDGLVMTGTALRHFTDEVKTAYLMPKMQCGRERKPGKTRIGFLIVVRVVLVVVQEMPVDFLVEFMHVPEERLDVPPVVSPVEKGTATEAYKKSSEQDGKGELSEHYYVSKRRVVS
jgi:hypothetical protein